ncbi:MAG: winged helix-turn-helix domain-containing protein [Sphingosinicella sp.]|uniref:winged helix-turn-helix domain-containing protein n=1 Tax=Sphingosinicella sp. TaxID=1917971 RepID=UPI00403776CF
MADGNPFDHNAIDDIVHGRIRLGAMAYLSAVDSALFAELRDKVGATDGNLSAHLRKLEEAGYVRVDKSFANRKPQTRLSLTRTGRNAWRVWLDHIERLTRAAANPGREE